jgi:hypothetical protein
VTSFGIAAARRDREPFERLGTACRHAGRAEQIKPREIVGGPGRAFFGGALHHVEAERRILLDAPAADNHRAERAHGFGIAGVCLWLERSGNFRFVDVDRSAVAQAIGDVARRIGIAVLGRSRRPGDAGALVARQAVAGQSSKPEQIFGGRLALDRA